MLNNKLHRRVRGAEAAAERGRGRGGRVAGGAVRPHGGGGGAWRRGAARMGRLGPSRHLPSRPLALQLWCSLSLSFLFSLVFLSSPVVSCAACGVCRVRAVCRVSCWGSCGREQEVGTNRSGGWSAWAALPQRGDVRGLHVRLRRHLQRLLQRPPPLRPQYAHPRLQPSTFRVINSPPWLLLLLLFSLQCIGMRDTVG